MSELKCPAVYKELFGTKYNKFCLSSGRISGKTNILVLMWWTYINNYEDRDIIVLQATATEIEDSIVMEIYAFLGEHGEDVGETPEHEWCIPKKRNIIKHRGSKNCTRIFPMTDSNGGQRTRGIKTKNKLSLILFEEVQKNKDRNILEQALATFIRHCQDGARIVVVGNSETVGHWFVDFSEEKKNDPDWCYIYANCYDIWDLLNEETKKFLISFREKNPIEFKRMYLGDIHASTSDVVFPQFTREKNYKKITEMEEHFIKMLFIGIDHATANDKFAVVPVAILEGGTTQTLEICCDDPQETQIALAPTEQCEILDEFLFFLDNRYGLTYNCVPIILSVDGAASPFIAQLRHTRKTSKHRKLWRDIMIKGFTMKKKDVNLGIIKNAFAYGVLTILNEGYKDWRGDINRHLLVKEIESLRYKNHKLDKDIPNDLCDALEYGLIPYYTNCYNLSFPVRTAEAHYKEIQELANKRR